MKERGGEITDRFLLNLVEHQISRIETCITTLSLRHMINPFKPGMLQQACPMSDILSTITEQMAELKMLKENANFEMGPAWAEPTATLLTPLPSMTLLLPLIDHSNPVCYYHQCPCTTNISPSTTFRLPASSSPFFEIQHIIILFPRRFCSAMGTRLAKKEQWTNYDCCYDYSAFVAFLFAVPGMDGETWAWDLALGACASYYPIRAFRIWG